METDHATFERLITNAGIALDHGDREKANSFFQEAANLRAAKVGEVSRLVASGGDGKVSHEDSLKMDTWYKSSALDQWLNPKIVATNKAEEIKIADIIDRLYNNYVEGIPIQVTDGSGRPVADAGGFIIRYIMDNPGALSPATERQYITGILAGTDSTGKLKQQIEAVEAMTQAVPKDATAEEKLLLRKHRESLQQSILAMRIRGDSVQAREEAIAGIAEVETANLLARAVRTGALPNQGLSPIGDSDYAKALKELVYHGNKGDLDPYIFLGTTQLGGIREDSVGNVSQLFAAANEAQRKEINKLLSYAEISLTEQIGEMVAEEETGDKEGYLRWKASDGNYYRLAVKGPQDSFYLEELVNGRWVKADIKRAANNRPVTEKEIGRIPESLFN
jgi:hypothetical protein